MSKQIGPISLIPVGVGNDGHDPADYRCKIRPPLHIAGFLLCLCLLAGCGSDDDELAMSSSPREVPSAVDGDTLFAVIGDFGEYDTASAEPDDDVLAVAALIDAWGQPPIITLGDNDYTAEGQTQAAYEGSVGLHFQPYLDRGEFYPVPGDHDYGDNCPDEANLSSYLEFFDLPTGPEDETYYDVRLDDVHLFLIDSVVDCHGDGGAKLARQRQWLAETALASDAAFKVVALHNPPFSSGTNHGSAEFTQWPFADLGIDVVMGGDDHIYERLERGGVVYIVNGLGGVERHQQPDELVAGSETTYADEFGALRVRRRGPDLELSFVNVRGEVIDSVRVTGQSTQTDGADLVPADDWFRPSIDATWQWQLVGGINTTYDVDVYDVDLFDVADAMIASLQSDGRRVICYFSAGSYESFREDAAVLDPSVRGSALDGFVDEQWLDIRSDQVRSLVTSRLDLARSKGCDAVEPDNVDGYANISGFALTPEDQLEFNRFVAQAAHDRGLGVGLKNDLDQIVDLVDAFDFAVNEQCHEFDECEVLQPFLDADKPVFSAEYLQKYVDDPDGVCASSRTLGLATLILPLDLDGSFRISCMP